MLADISSGNTEFADIMFLVALILFLVGGFLAWQAQALWAMVVSVGLSAVSLAWLVL